MYKVTVLDSDGSVAKPFCAGGCKSYADGECSLASEPFTVDEDIDLYLQELDKDLDEMFNGATGTPWDGQKVTHLSDLDGELSMTHFELELFYGALIVKKIDNDAGDTMLLAISGFLIGIINSDIGSRSVKSMIEWLSKCDDGTEWGFVARAWAGVLKGDVKGSPESRYSVERV